MPKSLDRPQFDLLTTILLKEYYATKDPDRSNEVMELLDAVNELMIALGYEGEG